jgi:phosphoribosylformimino-5-aminoimidazole carboxamide ribotide isomerase
MQIYPAIDLRGGRVVRLLQGDYAQETAYQNDPIALAEHYQAQGADWLHVVDLDAAKSIASPNLAIVAEIAKRTNLRIQFGGGVRETQDVEQRLALGCQRVVVGSMAVRAPEQVFAWKDQFGAEAICLALDCKSDSTGVYRVHIAGWQEQASAELFECVQRFADAGFVHALITDIARDGMLNGPNTALYAQLRAREPRLLVQASGGVSSLADLKQLRADKVNGVIIGKALLEGRFALSEALDA